jgi:hypothetical protein
MVCSRVNGELLDAIARAEAAEANAQSWKGRLSDIDRAAAKQIADLKAREAGLREALEIVMRASFGTLPDGWYTMTIRSDDYAKVSAALAQGGGA